MTNIEKKIMENFENYTYEELANMLYLKGEKDGYSKITDKSKWHEPVMAEKLGHTAHKKISAGAGALEYGSDAKDASNGIYAEYKAKCIVDEDLKNLFEKVRNVKSGKTFPKYWFVSYLGAPVEDKSMLPASSLLKALP